MTASTHKKRPELTFLINGFILKKCYGQTYSIVFNKNKNHTRTQRQMGMAIGRFVSATLKQIHIIDASSIP